MKLLADESVEKRIVDSLRSHGFDVLAIAELAPSLPDEYVLRLCVRRKRVLITNDKDFGELIFLEREVAEGIILLRFISEETAVKSKVLLDFLVCCNPYLFTFENASLEDFFLTPPRRSAETTPSSSFVEILTNLHFQM